LRRDLALELAQALTNSSTSAEHLASLKLRLDLLDRSLTALTPGPLSRLGPALLVGGLIALITTVLLLWRATFLPVIVDVEASAIALNVSEPTRIEHVLFAGGMQVRGVDWASSPRLPPTESDDSVGAIEIASNWLRLDEALIPAPSGLEIQASPEHFTALVSSNGVVEASIRQKGATTVVVGNQVHEFDLAEPESIRIGTRARENSPAALHTVEITGQPVEKHSFSFVVIPTSVAFVERADNEPRGKAFVSSVLTGTLSVPAVERKETLEPGDALRIEGFTAESARITVTDKVHLRLRGVAQHVRIGSGRFERSLAPTMLEYMAKNHMVGLLWSGFGLIGGLLWSVLRFFKS
jgi:hypothetical protein